MKKVSLSKLVLGSLVIVGLLAINFAIFTAPAKATDKIYNVSVYTYENSAALNWYTDQPYIGEINYGDSTDYGSRITKSVMSDWHSYELIGLQPGTTYFYQLVAKNKSGQVMAHYEGSLETWGLRQNLTVYKPFFYVNFNKGDFYSFNNQFPEEILNPNGLKSVEPSVWKGALTVKDQNSHLIYNAKPLFNAGYGTVMAWVRLESFGKDMTIWQSNDSRYALYFKHGVNTNQIVARAGQNQKNGSAEEAIYTFTTTGTNKNIWHAGEWHQLTMTWEGKMAGTVKLYIDGEQRASAFFSDGTGVRSFIIGNNYAHTQNFSNGQIDDFKLFDWALDSTSVRNEHRALALNQQKDLIKGQIAGAQVRNIKMGKLIKLANDSKIYLVGRDMTKIYVADVNALNRLGNLDRLVIVSDEELSQYANAGTFYSWSKYPDASLLKGSDNTVYWVWNGEKRAIANETVFNNFNNDWQDVITISNTELDTYYTGATYR